MRPEPVDPATVARGRSRRHAWLRAIAAFKLVKGVLLLAAALGFFRLSHADLGAAVQHWVTVLRMDPDNERIDAVLGRVAGLDPRALRELGVGSFIYAGLLLTEGAGLWLERRWAEYLVVVMTAAFVPLEAWALVHHPTLTRSLVLALNLAIVGYLVHALRSEVAGPPPPGPLTKEERR